MIGCALVGMNVRIASPKDFAPSPEIVAQAKALATNSEVIVTDDPLLAAQGSHVLYTDVWASMGQESEAQDRIPIFQPYQLNSKLMSLADRDAIALHCLPAHRGEEITDEVMEGDQSRIWDEAENRLHAQKALLASVL